MRQLAELEPRVFEAQVFDVADETQWAEAISSNSQVVASS